MPYPKFQKILKKTKRRHRAIALFFIIYLILPYLIPVSIQHLPTSTIVYDMHGEEIGEMTAEQTYRHRPLTGSDIPNFLQTTLIGIEDRRFARHHGIDRKGLGRAMIHNIQAGKVVEGGSTISSQLVRNTYRLNEPRTIPRKAAEFIGAWSLERKYSKEEILLAYMDRLYFGDMNYGFASASHWYFDKELPHLTQAEQLALIVIAKNANTYSPYKNKKAFRQRFERLAASLLASDIIDEITYTDIIEEELLFQKEHKQNFPYVLDFLIKEGQGVDLHTTIDAQLTKQIEAIGKQVIMDLQRKNVGDYGVLVIDRATNELRTMIGGVAYDGKDGQVNATTAINQAGSTMKPFTYILAFKELGYTPESKILDEPVQFPTVDNYAYSPKNFSLDYKGEVTLAEALAQSLNVPAVKLAYELGPVKLLDRYHQLGFDSLTAPSDHYGLALTLGVGEVSLRELARAFGMFAHDGQLCQIKLFADEQDDCIQLIEAKYTDMISFILADRYFKLGGFPLNSNLDFADRWVFAKSGTSRNFSDNWVIGFSDNYIIAVRVGNKDGSNMKGVSGASGAGEIFHRLVYLLEDRPVTKHPKLLDVEPLDPYVSISSPLPGSVFSIDPIIPLPVQNLSLKFGTNIDYDEARWTFNDELVDDNFWALKTGVFDVKVELLKEGEIVGEDRVVIVVKGE